MGQKRDFRILKSRILRARKFKTQVRYEKKNFDPRDHSWGQCQEYLANLSTRFSIAIASLDKEESKLINVGWLFFSFDSHRKSINRFNRVDVYDRWFNPVFLNCKIEDVQEYFFEIAVKEGDQRKRLDNSLYYIREIKNKAYE